MNETGMRGYSLGQNEIEIPDLEQLAGLLDSIYVEKAGVCILEQYYEPYERNSLHRMFSITKSYCGLAILALAAADKLNLEDPIIKYFPEYVKKPVHPWLAEMTIYDMLTMRTCHAKSTFNRKMSSNWVESFFTTVPNHRPGQVFQYDTSSSHTLAALVKKMTGKSVLDYLRELFLDEIGFSQEAYIIEDPFGEELGGSGLMAKTSDLACTARFLLDLVVTEKHTSMFWKKYSVLVKDALSSHTPTCHFGQTIDEQQGYGMQFWQVRNGGSAMYGLGGQYVILYPQYHMFVVTTADTQNIRGGNQNILDWINRYVWSIYGKSTETYTRPGTMEFRGCYEIIQTNAIFSKMVLEEEMVTFYRKGVHQKEGLQICFSLQQEIRGRVWKGGPKIFTRASVLPGDYLYLLIRNYDIDIGSLHILIHFEGTGRVGIYMRVAGMEGFEEFSGFYDGIIAM